MSSEIVRQQDAFLTHGVRHLRPLNLRTIADAIQMHESTVSRVTSNKYIATPRGVFELKYFFTASIQAVNGAESHSAEAVRDRIREMIEKEEGVEILSDDRIVSLLTADGVNIARRTVAKYREAMRIPSSVERRRLKGGPKPLTVKSSGFTVGYSPALTFGRRGPIEPPASGQSPGAHGWGTRRNSSTASVRPSMDMMMNISDLLAPEAVMPGVEGPEQKAVAAGTGGARGVCRPGCRKSAFSRP